MTTIFGRQRLLKQIADHHAKPVPDHISVVGPRSIGKSAILRAVHALPAGGSPVFAGAGAVDLRHDPPPSMEAVIARIAATLRTVLASSSVSTIKSVAEYIRPADPTSDVNDQLTLAIGEVADAGKRVLLILDGCDPVLQNSALPRNLWDNVRALAQSKGLRLMTGTRAPLHELCYNPDSRTSDFFRIFYDQPLTVSAFDDEDWSDIFARTPKLDPPAHKELRNWTGGHPDLVEQLLEQVLARNHASVTKTDVDECALGMVAGSARLDAIWRDCSEDLRRDILALCAGEMSAQDLPDERLRYLLARGIVVRSGGKVRLANRLLERKAASKKNDVSGMRELFGTLEAFNANVAKVLELRLATAPSLDSSLVRFITRAITDLREDPAACLGSARDILDRALGIVWACEAPDGKIPQRWVDAWKEQPSSAATRLVERVSREPDIPEDRGTQCDLLRSAAGTHAIRPVVGLRVSRTAVTLIDHMRHVGNLKNHGKGPTSETLAAAVCLSAIELAETLARDLR